MTVTSLLDLPDELLSGIVAIVVIQDFHALEPPKPGAWLVGRENVLFSICKRMRRIALPYEVQYLVICADSSDKQLNLRGLSADLSLVRYVFRIFDRELTFLPLDFFSHLRLITPDDHAVSARWPLYFLELLANFPSIEDIILDVVVAWIAYDYDRSVALDIDCEVFLSHSVLDAVDGHSTLKSLSIIGNADLVDGNFLTRLANHAGSPRTQICFEKATFDFSAEHVYRDDVSEEDILTLAPIFIRACEENRLRVDSLDILEAPPLCLERLFGITWNQNISTFNIHFDGPIQLTPEIVLQASTYGADRMSVFSPCTTKYFSTVDDNDVSDQEDAETQSPTFTDVASFHRPSGRGHSGKASKLSLHTLSVAGAFPRLLEEYVQAWEVVSLTSIWQGDKSIINNIVLGGFDGDQEFWTIPLLMPPEGSQHSAEEYTSTTFMVCTLFQIYNGFSGDINCFSSHRYVLIVL